MLCGGLFVSINYLAYLVDALNSVLQFRLPIFILEMPNLLELVVLPWLASDACTWIGTHVRCVTNSLRLETFGHGQNLLNKR